MNICWKIKRQKDLTRHSQSFSNYHRKYTTVFWENKWNKLSNRSKLKTIWQHDFVWKSSIGDCWFGFVVSNWQRSNCYGKNWPWIQAWKPNRTRYLIRQLISFHKTLTNRTYNVNPKKMIKTTYNGSEKETMFDKRFFYESCHVNTSDSTENSIVSLEKKCRKVKSWKRRRSFNWRWNWNKI